jgi:hypothetical protein
MNGTAFFGKRLLRTGEKKQILFAMVLKKKRN